MSCGLSCPLFEYSRMNKNAHSKWISIPLFQPCCCPALSKWYQMMHSKPNSLVMYTSNFFTGLKGLSASFQLMLMHYSNFWQEVNGVFFTKKMKSGVHLAFLEKKWLFITKLIIRRGQNNNRIKPNYFKKQHSSSSSLFTWSRYTSPKWPWSLSRLVSCLKWMELGFQVLGK